MKRFIAALICVTLLPFSSAVYADDASELDSVNPTVFETELPHSMGYEALDLCTYDGAQPDIISLYDDIPTSYQLDDKFIPTVKDQGITSNCWAFSAADALTSNMYKQGFLDKSEGKELSVEKLSWYTLTKNKMDEDGNVIAEGDTAYVPTSIGANYSKAVSTYANGISDYASNLPFSPYSYGKSSLIGSGGESVSVVSVDSMHSYSNNPDTALVKEALMNNGAIGIVYCHENDYFNSTTNAYYCGTGDTVNHAVLLVGWNDDFSAENFNESNRPENNGAWIAKNSWSSSWGNGGYFYISYEETNLSFYSLVADENTYDRVYSHSAQNYSGYIKFTEDEKTDIANGGILNTYTAKADGQIKKISFFSGNNNLSYTLKIYRDVATDACVSNEPYYTEDGLLSVEGLNSIKLETPVDIKEGEKFSVELDFSVDGEALIIYVEQDYGDYNYTSKEGESYLVDLESDTPTYIDTLKLSEESEYGIFHNFPVYVAVDNTSDDADIETYQKKLSDLLTQCKAVNSDDYSSFTAQRLADTIEANENAVESTDLQELKNAYGRINEAYLGLDKPLEITSADDFTTAAAAINSSSPTEAQAKIQLKTQIELNSDITLTASDSTVFDGLYGFEFDGNDHSITVEGDNCEGFIGDAYDDCIKDITIEGNFSTTSSSYIGGIANWALYGTTIKNCCVKGSVTNQKGFAGGLVGCSYSNYGKTGATVINCTNRADITATESSGGGGIVAAETVYDSTIEYGTIIERCVNFGDVKTAKYAGGILGALQANTKAKIKDCGNNGLIEGSTYCGSIVPYSYKRTECSGCYNFSNTVNTASSSQPTYDLANGTSKADFLNGKVAYLLNTENDTATNSGLWALVDGETVIADDTHGGVSAVNVKIDNKEAFDIYANYKDSVKLTPSVDWTYNNESITVLTARSDLNNVTVTGTVNEKGDVNSDKQCSKNDAALVLKHISDISSLDLINAALADVDNNGSVDLRDVISILNYCQS